MAFLLDLILRTQGADRFSPAFGAKMHRPDQNSRRPAMFKDQSTKPRKGGWLSIDEWAVIVALVLALAVKFDVLKNVPW
jgi:hypothetical protein